MCDRLSTKVLRESNRGENGTIDAATQGLQVIRLNCVESSPRLSSQTKVSHLTMINGSSHDQCWVNWYETIKKGWAFLTVNQYVLRRDFNNRTSCFTFHTKNNRKH